MNKENIYRSAYQWWQESGLNLVPAEYAFREDLIDMPMYDEPIFAVADAHDPLFAKMKEPGIIGPHYLTPEEWLPGAQSVISFFLPFTEAVRNSNRKYGGWPSSEWQHARIEGELAIGQWKRYIASLLESEGDKALVPSDDPRFQVWEPISSNWSERHAAFIAGLGTFGLSKGLITRKGMSGRYGSIITTAKLEPDVRPYTDVYEYCTKCGACAVRCPANAIRTDVSPNLAKNQQMCGAFLQPLKDLSKDGGDTRPEEDRLSGYTPEKQRIHFGCGKCQVAVPCESGIPAKVK